MVFNNNMNNFSWMKLHRFCASATQTLATSEATVWVAIISFLERRCTLCDLCICSLRPIRKFHKKLGQQAWLVAAITVTEFLIVVKYDPNTIMLPIPFFIMQCWFLGLILIVIWTVWKFFIRYVGEVLGGVVGEGKGLKSNTGILKVKVQLFPAWKGHKLNV